jgi:hypothetical protein
MRRSLKDVYGLVYSRKEGYKFSYEFRAAGFRPQLSVAYGGASVMSASLLVKLPLLTR